MWQVSLLLANADKPLPPAALGILRGEAPAPAAPVAAAQNAGRPPANRRRMQMETGLQVNGKDRNMSVLDSLRKGFGFLPDEHGHLQPGKEAADRKKACLPSPSVAK
jgi:hypothetical protein